MVTLLPTDRAGMIWPDMAFYFMPVIISLTSEQKSGHPAPELTVVTEGIEKSGTRVHFQLPVGGEARPDAVVGTGVGAAAGPRRPEVVVMITIVSYFRQFLHIFIRFPSKHVQKCYKFVKNIVLPNFMNICKHNLAYSLNYSSNDC
jgi:hypothetical protein